MRGASALLLALLFVLPVATTATSSQAASPDDLVMQVLWSTDQPLGDATVELTVELPDQVMCSFYSNAGGSTHERGAAFHWVDQIRDGKRVSGFAVASMRSQSVHVGDLVDTRGPIKVEGVATVFPLGAWGARSWANHTQPTQGGVVQLAVGGLDLRVTNEAANEPGGRSVALGITCDKPFAVVGWSAGRDVLSWNGQSMAGGVGAFVSLGANVNLAAREEADFDAALVRTVLSHRTYQAGAQQGELVWTNPDFTLVRPLDQDHRFSVVHETAGGLHTWELTQVAADFFSSLGAHQYGLDPYADLDAFVAGLSG